MRQEHRGTARHRPVKPATLGFLVVAGFLRASARCRRRQDPWQQLPQSAAGDGCCNLPVAASSQMLQPAGCCHLPVAPDVWHAAMSSTAEKVQVEQEARETPDFSDGAEEQSPREGGGRGKEAGGASGAAHLVTSEGNGKEEAVKFEGAGGGMGEGMGGGSEGEAEGGNPGGAALAK